MWWVVVSGGGYGCVWCIGRICMVYGVLVVYSCICIGVSNRVGASGLGIG